MPQRTTRISALTLEIVAGRAPYPWRPRRWSSPKLLRPDWLPAVALSSALAAADARLEPAGRRPRRPGLPHRAVPARRPGDLERQLVRRPLHPHLQRPLPAAGGAARPAGGRRARGRRLLLPLRPPRPRPLGRRRRAGRPSGSRPASSPCSPTASSPSPSASPSASPRCAACSSAAPRSALAAAAACALSSPVAAAFLAGVVLVGGARARRRRVSRVALWVAGARPRPRRRPQPRLPRTGPVPLRLLLLRRDPALVRRRRCSSPAACAARSGSCAGS